MEKSPEQMLKEWKIESHLANESIVEILTSYMACVNTMKQVIEQLSTVDDRKLRELLASTAKMTLNWAEECWSPILKKAKETLQLEEVDEGQTETI